MLQMDRQTDGRMEGQTDGRSGPNTRPAFAKVTQVTRKNTKYCTTKQGTNTEPTMGATISNEIPASLSHWVNPYKPLAGYGLPPPKGNFVDHIFLESECLARILQHVSPLTMAAFSCNSLLHTLPYKIFHN